MVNLIPYNATDVKDKLQCPSDEHMLEFRNIVQSYGTFVTIRRTMGADIASACGQLVQKKNKEQDEKEAAKKLKAINELGGEEKTIDIEDVVMVRKGEKTSQNKSTTFVSKTGALASDTSPEANELDQQDDLSPSSWRESMSNDDLEWYARALTFATSISATCFLASSVLYLKRRR